MLDRLDMTRLGEMPPLGIVPERMLAQLIRPERYGEPRQAFAVEEVETPLPRAGEALVYVMAAGGDPIVAPSSRIWGYETNWGSFAQFSRVQAHQLLPKPPQLPWAAAAAYMLVGATAYRMLCGWAPHTVEKGDVVLVWGGSGGLGSQAIQIVRAKGGLPVAVVSGEDK